MASAGLTAEDYLAELPAMRRELILENYDPAMVARLRDDYARVRQDTAFQTDDGDPPMADAE